MRCAVLHDGTLQRRLAFNECGHDATILCLAELHDGDVSLQNDRIAPVLSRQLRAQGSLQTGLDDHT